jgi:hypothetical protein
VGDSEFYVSNLNWPELINRIGELSETPWNTWTSFCFVLD